MTTQAKIVLVEDNEINLRLMQAQLGHLGYERIESFSLATMALMWLSANACDLVLTDCQMEPMDGLELTREIRKLDARANQHTIIIAATAGAMPDDLRRCIDAGMDDYLVKPIGLAALRAMLDKWLAPGPAHASKH